MDIAAFLTARFDEEHADAVAAQEADSAPWHADVTDGASTQARTGHGAGLVIAADDEALWDCEGSHMLCMTAATARHVARWNPAHVLADVAAKRAIVEDYVLTCRFRDEAATRIERAREASQIDSAALDDWHRAERETSILGGVLERLASAYAGHAGYDPNLAMT